MVATSLIGRRVIGPRGASAVVVAVAYDPQGSFELLVQFAPEEEGGLRAAGLQQWAVRDVMLDLSPPTPTSLPGDGE